ncbi:MAG: efflux RND transporter periplasmic adaptor subunit [Rhodothalassiaceae bacterium]
MAISRPDAEGSNVEQLKFAETLRQSGIGAGDAPPGLRRGRSSRLARIGLWVLLILLLATALLAGARGYFPRREATVAVRVLELAPPSGSGEGTASAPALPVSGIEATGYVIAERSATVSSSIVGRVSEVLVAVGDSVKANDLVARMDDRAQRIELDRLKIDLDTAYANLKAREAELALAQSELKRARYLVERDAASPALLEEKQNRAEIAEAERVSVALSIEMTRQRIALQEQVLEELAIRAPFDGVVTHVTANPGEIVSPASGGGTFTRTGICTIIDLQSIMVSVQINEKFLPRIAVGDPVGLTFPAIGEQMIDGSVDRIAPYADRQTGTIDILIAPDRAWRDKLRPGIRALASFASPSSPAAVASDQMIIPAKAVFRDEAGTHVFVYEAGRARRIGIEGRELENGDFRIKAPGLGSLHVIVWSSAALFDGQPVSRK